MSSTTSLALSGLASGFNWQNLVSELATVSRAPETQLKTQAATQQTLTNTYSTVGNDLTAVGNDLTNLSNPAFFQSVTAQSSASGVATATAAQGTATGQYNFNFTRIATATQQIGTSHVGAALSSTSNVSGVVLSSAPLAIPVTTGTFTVNGTQITVGSSDTLETVLNDIGTATGGAVTASYDPATDKVKLSSSSPITLGSGADTSNFLQAFKLVNNGTGTVTSSGRLGTLDVEGNMTGANAATSISDGGSGAGQFSINGVTINFDASAQSISDVINEINQSSAGVTASYDPSNDRLLLTDNSTGDVGMSLKDLTGNFLQATGLLGGTTQDGDNLEYTVNDGAPLTSQSNTITNESSGITGLTVTAVTTGTATVSVASDTSSIVSAITNFVNDYNTVQSYISTNAAVTTATDGSGTVTPGALTGDATTETISSQLRSLAQAFNTSLPGGVQGLDDIGVNSNGNNNTLAIDTTTLTSALQSNLPAVTKLFTDPTNGLAVKLTNFINQTAGNPSQGIVGTLPSVEGSVTANITNINNQVTTIENGVQAQIQEWDQQFQAMEQAEQQANQNLQFLAANFSTANTSGSFASNLSSASNALSSSLGSSGSSGSTTGTSGASGSSGTSGTSGTSGA